ncbi:BMP family protein [Candidatus Binatus sp.]|uniref:BMP family protein n=1 Tax=Candidatus Binatus sp. TaxID=2811406 RepID=UPI002F94578B
MDSADPRTYLKRKFPAIALALLQIGVLGACTSHPALGTKHPSDSAFRVALLTPGPVSDAGWNAAAYEGLELIKTRLGADTALVQTKSPADFEDAFRDFASRGFDLIFAHGFEYTDSAIEVARSFPNTCFVVSSGSESSANVASITFNVDQATYVEGVLAAGVSKTGVVGAVGGIELPSIRLFFEGFKRGFLSVQPKGRILISYTGNFDDVGAAKEAALAQISQGADVLIHNADAAGLGVFLAAARAHVFAFGVFNNQNGVAPDVVLASAVTSTPLAFLKIATEVKDKRFHPGMLEFGMHDGMVRVVFNPKLESRISAAALKRARQVEHELATGQLVLPPTLMQPPATK